MSQPLTAKFEVARCTTTEDKDGAVYTLLLEPCWPDFDGDPDSAVDGMLYDLQTDQPGLRDFAFLTLTRGDGVEGVEISSPEPLKPGTKVELELRVLP